MRRSTCAASMVQRLTAPVLPDKGAANDSAPCPVVLRARLRRVPSCPERTRKCGVVRRTTRAEIVRSRVGNGVSTRWSGMCTCQSIHACPVCADKIRRKRASQIRAAVEQGRLEHPTKRWRMLTVTLRHDVDMPLRALARLVLDGWRKTRQRGTVQRIWKAKVAGTVRAIEVTRGENGWHPHLHLLVLTEEWSTEEMRALESTWSASVQKLAVERRIDATRVAPDARIALRWSSSRQSDRTLTRTQYLAKMGWELGGLGKGAAQWAIAERAASGDREAAMLWDEYVHAMKGVRAIECDERAADFARRHPLAYAVDVDATAGAFELSVEIGPFRLATMRDAERWRPTITRDVLLAAARASPTEDAVYAAFDAVCAEALAMAPRCGTLAA